MISEEQKQILEQAGFRIFTDKRTKRDIIVAADNSVSGDATSCAINLIKLVKGRLPSFPEVVCLCGSSRFYKEYQEAEYAETMAGRIYLSIGFYPHAVAEMHGEGVGHSSQEKVALDELHKRKIDLADSVLVIAPGGYIGSSTKSEIEYAKATNKPIRWFYPDQLPEEYR